MKLTIGHKLAFAFFAMIVFIMIWGVFSLWMGHKLNARAAKIEHHWLPSTTLAGEMKAGTSDFRIWQGMHHSTAGQEKMLYEKKLNEEIKMIKADEALYVRLISSEKEKVIYESFVQKWEEYLRIYENEFLPQSKANQSAEAMAVLSKTSDLFDELSSELYKLVQFNKEGGIAESQLADKEYDFMSSLTAFTAFFSTLAAIMFAFFLSRSITKPLNLMAAQVSSASRELFLAADQINTTTQEISSTVQQIAKGAQTTAHRVDETSKVMEQMNASVNEVAQGAQQAASASVQARQVAQNGHEAVEETILKMNNIFTTIASSARVVKKLGERSEEISNIVKLINDIADQTNLLALNAAIEAARAGEAGRGFAVVADEVRKLAEGSSKAADQISGLIKEIQKETSQAVIAMEAGSKEVAEGREVVTQSGQALKEIVKVVEHTASMVEQISAASEQMAAGTKQVVKAVDEIAANAEESASATEEAASSTEEMTASMEEMTASAQSLADLAIKLREMVKRVNHEPIEEEIEYPSASETVFKDRRQPLLPQWKRPRSVNGGRKSGASISSYKKTK